MLRADIESQQALRLLADDELSTATWLRDIRLAPEDKQAPVNSQNQQTT
jgi:hypothetical protein